MKTRRFTLAVLAIGCTGALGLAASFTWVGLGADDDWDTCKNWVVAGLGGCSPSSTSDDATIPSTGSPWTVNLITEEIDDLTITGDVTFGGSGTLTVDTVTIDGSAGAVTVEVDGSVLQTS